MPWMFVIAMLLALGFAFTNGFLDAANAIATLVTTRAATPGQAIILASVFNMLGPLLVGAAVANMIGGLVQVSPGQMVLVVACGLGSAVAWNVLAWWRGIPSSSGHALVGGLAGAGLACGGLGAVNWGGFNGWHPVGVLGTLAALAISPVLGVLVALFLTRVLARLSRRWTVKMRGGVRAGQWLASSALAFSHGSNDAQKSVGVMAAILLASGHSSSLSAPLWVPIASAAALTVGTALGGWRVVKTIGKRIYKIKPLDGLASQMGSTAVILSASLLGAPVSTTHVVSSSIVGIGGGRHRWRRVRWHIVREILLTWVTTLPGTALIAAALFFTAHYFGA
jgi:PiT family inorganic phosphate transporter